MSNFGTHLRKFRVPKLSQQKVGELLGTELGIQRYSGAAVSDWERGKSKIHADDRLVLITLIKILHEHGGINTIEDANQLLEAGNYRALDSGEARKVFQDFPDRFGSEQPIERMPEPDRQSWLANLFSISQEELDKLLSKAREGPEPSWPRVLAALMRTVSDHFSISPITILWIWIWLLAWWTTGPSLQLPYANRDTAFLVLCVYASGTLILPLLIGVLVNTKDNEYWRGQAGASPFLLRIYTYQGAGIGFNVGYFLVFPVSLAVYYLGFHHTALIEIVSAAVSVILGNMAARVVPHNLWRAYQRLTFADGGIFFIFALIGPLWALFFFEYYAILLRPAFGIIIILLALTGVAILSGRISKKNAA